MRQLTEDEIKSAPDGYPEYGFNRSGEVFFFNRELGTAVIDGVDEALNLSKGHYAFKECKPIPEPREPFDITKHEFSDRDFKVLNVSDKIHALVTYDEKKDLTIDICHSKDDVIAMTKALGITGDDLK